MALVHRALVRRTCRHRASGFGDPMGRVHELKGYADPQQCEQWGLSALEWKTQVEMAIITLKFKQK